ncbi:hypothetical protein TNCV_1691691 [Trichonephila clavipes]|nr:hypothetical protein TNCV_1691691 [Trichonephila clavipes]
MFPQAIYGGHPFQIPSGHTANYFLLDYRALREGTVRKKMNVLGAQSKRLQTKTIAKIRDMSGFPLTWSGQTVNQHYTTLKTSFKVRQTIPNIGRWSLCRATLTHSWPQGDVSSEGREIESVKGKGRIEEHEIPHDKRLSWTAIVSRTFQYHTGGRTIWLVSTPILTENTLGIVRVLPPLFPFHQPQERTCGSQGLFKVLPWRKSTIHLQTSMPSPGYKPRPYGTAVSVTNQLHRMGDIYSM